MLGRLRCGGSAWRNSDLLFLDHITARGVRAGGDIDVIRKGVDVVLQALVDTEAAEVIGAARDERSESDRGGLRP